MRRRFIFYIIVVLMFLVFTGCGSEKPKQAEQDVKSATIETSKPAGSQSAAGDKSPETVQTIPASENKKGTLSVATGKSVELPKGYPSDKFPLYEGSFIYSAIELDGSYTLTAYSKDEVKKVIAFYEKVLEGAKVYMDTKTDESLTSMGTKSGYAYTMDVGKSTEQGYRTIITISLQPAK